MTFSVIGYSSSNTAFRVTSFTAPASSSQETIKEAARQAISQTFSFGSLPVKSLTLQVDNITGYVHILDKMNVNFAR